MSPIKQLLPIALIAACLMNRPAASAPPEWPEEALEIFSTLPVLDNGRVKPLDTVARFTLLRLNGKRSIVVEHNGKRIRRTPMEWYLDCLFYPETAKTYRCFGVETDDAIVALGLSPHGKKRDRYSYHDLAPGRDRLMALANEASHIAEEQQDFISRQIIALAGNVLAFERIIHFLDIARASFNARENLLLAGAFTENEVRSSDIAAVLPTYLLRLTGNLEQFDESTRDAIAHDMHELFNELDSLAGSGDLLALFPPHSKADKEWATPAAAFERAFDTHDSNNSSLAMLELLENLVEAVHNKAAFVDTSRAFHNAVVTVAQTRGEYRKIPLEVSYYRGRFFFLSQWLFLATFIISACAWTLPPSKRIIALLNMSLLPPLVLLATGIAVRCLIRGRPPVTNSYETILFTTFIAGSLGFVIEFMNRRRIAMSVGAALGALGMFLAARYEARGGMDTMPAVIAVLDTNFWLATHVTTIIVGYGAGLFASALAHVYLSGRLLGIGKSASFYSDFGRIIYGVVCFCLLFTLIGTILGGVWAAQSWGRFWGWDPKENGALLIVLWALAMMHARLGGYLRHGGIAVCAVVLGMIIVFAWWGVNALGVGLHSYGFVSGVWRNLLVFWVIESLVVAAGLVALKRGAGA